MSCLKINGGYATIKKWLFMFELRDENNGALCDFAHAVSRNEACRYVSKPGLRIAKVYEEHEMSADELEQAKEWLRGK